MPPRQTAVQQTKTRQTAKQQQVVKINIGDMPKKKRRTRRRKPSAKKPMQPPQSISIIQPFYQPLYPSFTPSIPQFMPPPPPPFAEGIKVKEKQKEKPLLPEPEMPLAEPPVQRPSIGRRFAQGVVAGLGALGSLGEPREITEMPYRRPFSIPKSTQTFPPETRTKKVGTEIMELPQAESPLPSLPKRELVSWSTPLPSGADVPTTEGEQARARWIREESKGLRERGIDVFIPSSATEGELEKYREKQKRARMAFRAEKSARKRADQPPEPEIQPVVSVPAKPKTSRKKPFFTLADIPKSSSGEEVSTKQGKRTV
jgi:hypothetical protein